MILVGVLLLAGVIQVSLGLEYCEHLLTWGNIYYWGDVVALMFGGIVSLAQAFNRVLKWPQEAKG